MMTSCYHVIFTTHHFQGFTSIDQMGLNNWTQIFIAIIQHKPDQNCEYTWKKI